jgi:hypothetical protein
MCILTDTFETVTAQNAAHKFTVDYTMKYVNDWCTLSKMTRKWHSVL